MQKMNTVQLTTGTDCDPPIKKNVKRPKEISDFIFSFRPGSDSLETKCFSAIHVRFITFHKLQNSVIADDLSKLRLITSNGKLNMQLKLP